MLESYSNDVFIDYLNFKIYVVFTTNLLRTFDKKVEFK